MSPENQRRRRGRNHGVLGVRVSGLLPDSRLLADRLSGDGGHSRPPSRERSASNPERKRPESALSGSGAGDSRRLMTQPCAGRYQAALAIVWPELEIVAEARNGREAVRLFDERRPRLAGHLSLMCFAIAASRQSRLRSTFDPVDFGLDLRETDHLHIDITPHPGEIVPVSGNCAHHANQNARLGGHSRQPRLRVALEDEARFGYMPWPPLHRG